MNGGSGFVAVVRDTTISHRSWREMFERKRRGVWATFRINRGSTPPPPRFNTPDPPNRKQMMRIPPSLDREKPSASRSQKSITLGLFEQSAGITSHVLTSTVIENPHLLLDVSTRLRQTLEPSETLTLWYYSSFQKKRAVLSVVAVPVRRRSQDRRR